MSDATSKICKKCMARKTISEFYASKKGLYGRRSKCRICESAEAKLRLTPEKKKAETLAFWADKPLYTRWQSMNARCNNPSHASYSRYGGRGIKICKEWAVYRNFEKDMLPSYKKGLSLDRIDNNDGYYFGNCRWATSAEQMANTSRVHRLTFQGATKSIKQWAEHINMSYDTLYARLYTYKWPLEKALTFNI